MITDIHQLDLQKTYTYADYLTWRFKERVELIKGRIFKISPAPNAIHQEVSGNIHGFLWNYLKEKPCKVFHAPFDVRLPSLQQEVVHTVVQPDICVVCDLKKIDQYGCIGAPDLVIEILSKSTSHKDLNEKKDLYEYAGVLEYWVVHPFEGTLIPFVLQEDGKYLQIGIFTIGDTVTSIVLPNFELSLVNIFPNDYV